MSEPLIVNWGKKYKGCSVYDLLADTNYCQWIETSAKNLLPNLEYCRQWVATNGNGSTFIANNTTNIIVGSNTNVNRPTPEHNRLQNKFLDDMFTLEFLSYVVYGTKTFPYIQLRDRIVEILGSPIEGGRCSKPVFESDKNWDVKVRLSNDCQTFLERNYQWVIPDDEREAHEKELQELQQQSRMFYDELSNYKIIATEKRRAEIYGLLSELNSRISNLKEQHEQYKTDQLKKHQESVDAYLEDKHIQLEKLHPMLIFELSPVYSKAETRCIRYYSRTDTTFWIEIKTLVGDDYPGILRKMQSEFFKDKKDYVYILLIDKLDPDANITRHQLVEIFGRSNIRVIFFDELEDQTKITDIGLVHVEANVWKIRDTEILVNLSLAPNQVLDVNVVRRYLPE